MRWQKGCLAEAWPLLIRDLAAGHPPICENSVYFHICRVSFDTLSYPIGMGRYLAELFQELRICGIFPVNSDLELLFCSKASGLCEKRFLQQI
jgi:hypothetical protein